MKAMILVWGSSERGKSQSIKSVAKAMPFVSYISPWHDDDYDSYVIGTVKEGTGDRHPSQSRDRGTGQCLAVA